MYNNVAVAETVHTNLRKDGSLNIYSLFSTKETWLAEYLQLG